MIMALDQMEINGTNGLIQLPNKHINYAKFKFYSKQ